MRQQDSEVSFGNLRLCMRENNGFLNGWLLICAREERNRTIHVRFVTYKECVIQCVPILETVTIVPAG